MQRPLSARQRAPIGRTNSCDFEEPTKPRPKSACLSSNNSNYLFQKPSDLPAYSKPNIEPTLYVERIPNYKPTLPPSRHPTVPPPEPKSPNRYRKPLVCPQKWVDENSKPLQRLSFKDLIDVDVKTKLAREFIENNMHRIEKFDLKYKHKSPNEICYLLVNNPNLASLLERYRKLEKQYELSSSEQVKETFQDDGWNSLGEITSDPFIASINTPRYLRDVRLQNVLNASRNISNANSEDDFRVFSKYRRGYRHDCSFGNFSQLNGLLAKNNSKLF